jgi:hypothetical protein
MTWLCERELNFGIGGASEAKKASGKSKEVLNIRIYIYI